ncbi:MAG: chromosome condensation regulator, partial [Lachnospiraceae bacterium]|nr:chromosome condensation regulator [Lachnospiraceae bacterium]
VAISAGDHHTVGLKRDGSVVAAGSNKYGQCDVFSWRNIMAVSAGGSHTAAIQKT